MAQKSEFELIGKLGLGQYIPTGSVIHRLDPRIKILLAILLIATSIISSSLVSILTLFIIIFTGLLVAKVQIRLAFITLRSMIPFLFVLALIQVFAVPQLRDDANLIWQWRIFVLTDRSLLAGILLLGRFSVIVLGLSLFSYSTTTTELIHGIEHLLRPLGKLRFPAHELALVSHISIRFLPILVLETERLMKAQASRGADFGSGRGNFVRRIRRILPLLVPLFIVSLRHAYNLAEAMESRCYVGGIGRTQLIQLHAEIRDFIALTLGIVTAGASFFLSYIHFDEILWERIAVFI
jgi:energy-coupling factor transport system permease protein